MDSNLWTVRIIILFVVTPALLPNRLWSRDPIQMYRAGVQRGAMHGINAGARYRAPGMPPPVPNYSSYPRAYSPPTQVYTPRYYPSPAPIFQQPKYMAQGPSFPYDEGGFSEPYFDNYDDYVPYDRSYQQGGFSPSSGISKPRPDPETQGDKIRILPNEAPFFRVKMPNKDCSVALSCPNHFAHQEGRWRKYYFDDYQALMKNGASFSVTLSWNDGTELWEEVVPIRLVIKDSKPGYFHTTLEWKKPKRTLLGAKAWVDWSEKKQKRLTDISNEFQAWVQGKKKSLGASSNTEIYETAITELDRLSAQFDAQHKLLLGEFLSIQKEIPNIKKETSEATQGLEVKRIAFEQRSAELGSAFLGKCNKDFDALLNRQTTVLNYQTQTLEHWREAAEKDVSGWAERQIARYISEPEGEIEIWKRANQREIDALPPGDLKARMAEKASIELVRRVKMLSAREMAKTIEQTRQKEFEQIEALKPSFLSEFQNALATPGTDAKWGALRQALLVARTQVEANNSEIVKNAREAWKAYPLFKVRIEVQRRVLEKLRIAKEVLLEDEKRFSTSFVAKQQAEKNAYLKWRELELARVEPLPNGPWKDDVKTAFETEERLRSLAVQSSEALINDEVLRRKTLGGDFIGRLAAKLEVTTLEQSSIKSEAEHFLTQDRPVREKFSESFGKTLHNSKDYVGLEILIPQIKANFPWPLLLPKECEGLQGFISEKGSVTFSYSGRPLLSLADKHIIDLSCQQGQMAVLISEFQGHRKTHSPYLVIVNPESFSALPSPVSTKGRYTSCWASEGRWLVREELEGEFFLHSFSMDGSEQDLVDDAEPPVKAAKLLLRASK